MAKRNHPEEPADCDSRCKRLEVPTEDELEALNAMRAIKNRVREIRNRLSETNSGSVEKKKEGTVALERELEDLKVQWNEWEERRKEAARQRMILLGHEEGN